MLRNENELVCTLCHLTICLCSLLKKNNNNLFVLGNKIFQFKILNVIYVREYLILFDIFFS